MDRQAALGWRCLAPDLRGFGESPAPGEGWAHYTVDAMADDLHGLLGRLSLGRFIVVGHSMGGKVALALAARQPAGMAGLALLAPSPPTPEPMEPAERARLLGRSRRRCRPGGNPAQDHRPSAARATLRRRRRG